MYVDTSSCAAARPVARRLPLDAGPTLSRVEKLAVTHTYSDRELAAMMADIESELVERKQSLRMTRGTRQGPIEKIRKAVCAFANDLPGHRCPGVVFVGVRDDGTPSGIEVTDRLLQRLADIKTDGSTLPPPAMSVTKRTLAGCDVAVVTVQPSDAPPVRARGQMLDPSWAPEGDCQCARRTYFEREAAPSGFPIRCAVCLQRNAVGS